MIKIYTHDTSKCQASKGNCAKMQGMKLKPSRAKSRFNNDTNWCELPCPSGRKLENQPGVATITKGIHSLISRLALVTELVPDKAP